MEVNIQEAERLAGAAPEAGAWQAVIRPHHSVYDGRFAANAWLQELPDPVTKQVWGNAAAISPASAAELGVGDGDMLEVSVGGASVALPAAVQRGVAPGVAVLTLGHGRRAGGLVIAEADGANVAPLMQGRAPRCVLKAGVKKGQGRGEVVRTQKERQMQGRDIVVDGTLDEYRHDPAFVKHKQHVPDMVDLYEPFEYGARNFKWGMAIDLNRCTGCGACVASCQAENNIAVVGREECANGREMHWMRIDRYEEGDPANPRIHLQPMLCQQCDNAPCEPVCPMNATVHSPEGLNEMAYNRCVGTRFCSNNCPYKVRRFNFLHYHTKRMTDAVQELVFNPEVTVRDAGVMEKCTFCVQRINKEKFEAYNAGRPLRDGTVVPACAQACPAQAIVFGNLNDPDSRVSKMRESGRAFYVLPELNAKPVIAYLARVRNPGVADAAESEGGGHA
jgi:molybdopterin-containing oxidoreductase family iron-sulfur binding subunit